MFCDNPECTFKTFSERFDFVNPKAKKTNRLIEKILVMSTKLSSVSASSLLKWALLKFAKAASVICLKKMPVIVDKLSVVRVCMDDFAIRKRYTYGTVMVDLDTHRIIDLIDSRETKKWRNGLNLIPT